MSAPITPELRRTLAVATAALALAAGTTVGTANTATAAERASADCGDVWIGDHAQYMYQQVSAGWVDQYWDTCNDRVGVYWTWDPTFRANNPRAWVDLYVSSPYGLEWDDVLHTTADAGPTAGGDGIYAHDATDPKSEDAWRAGAEINSSSCVQWGWLHWYGGANWDGARGGCRDVFAPLRDGTQPHV
ncbi:hypothetical protein [Streptomyces sp. MMG1121]|uniref:hypothetical protein n=1 Tax=Streptomyces sp. MMG1121 TaxID=1415544 RepID=UPI0006ADCBBA|nr:hypothetical protein [Streptomyces sp. MMG1121]KOV61023.1 hypothetical protein ADK64_28920 [Streptomyces sp. MMG1121]